MDDKDLLRQRRLQALGLLPVSPDTAASHEPVIDSPSQPIHQGVGPTIAVASSNQETRPSPPASPMEDILLETRSVNETVGAVNSSPSISTSATVGPFNINLNVFSNVDVDQISQMVQRIVLDLNRSVYSPPMATAASSVLPTTRLASTSIVRPSAESVPSFNVSSPSAATLDLPFSSGTVNVLPRPVRASSPHLDQATAASSTRTNLGAVPKATANWRERTISDSRPGSSRDSYSGFASRPGSLRDSDSGLASRPSTSRISDNGFASRLSTSRDSDNGFASRPSTSRDSDNGFTFRPSTSRDADTRGLASRPSTSRDSDNGFASTSKDNNILVLSSDSEQVMDISKRRPVKDDSDSSFNLSSDNEKKNSMSAKTVMAQMAQFFKQRKLKKSNLQSDTSTDTDDAPRHASKKRKLGTGSPAPLSRAAPCQASDDPNRGNCSICYTNPPDCLLRCKHAYCEECLKVLLGKKKPCPRCQKKFRVWDKVFL